MPLKYFYCRRCDERFIRVSETRVRRCEHCAGRLRTVWMPDPPSAEPGTYPVGAYASIEAFVSEDARRLSSREVDFGLCWREQSSGVIYRAAWVEETHELYVAQLGPPNAGGGHVEVLAVCDRADLDAALAGWQARCMEAGSLDWIRVRASLLSGSSYLARQDAMDRSVLIGLFGSSS